MKDMVDRDAVTVRVYEELRQRIVNGDLLPGSILRESALAEEFKASRTPVREAIQRLLADGLVITRGHSRGVEVPAWDAQHLEEMYRLRANLEAWSARQAATRLTDDDIKLLQHLADAMTNERSQPEVDLERIAQLNVEFHDIVRSRAGGQQYRETTAAVIHVPLLHRVFHVFTKEEVVMTLEEHHTMVRAFKAQDQDWAESITRAHILAAMHALLQSSPLTPQVGP